MSAWTPSASLGAVTAARGAAWASATTAGVAAAFSSTPLKLAQYVAKIPAPAIRNTPTSTATSFPNRIACCCVACCCEWVCEWVIGVSSLGEET